MEKAFDMILHDRLLHILQTEYGIGMNMLEFVRHILINIRYQVMDGKGYFNTTMAVK